MTTAPRYLYIFLDEAGNLDFSATGTRYFVLGALTKERPFHAYKELTDLKYDLAEKGTDLEYFHASENAQPVRNDVFGIINRNLGGTRLDFLVVEKRKVEPRLRAVEKFYPMMLGHLLKFIFEQSNLGGNPWKECLIYTDALPVEKKREAIKKGIKETLAGMLPKDTRYRIFHHVSKSNMDLQIADYCTWAVYRKWKDGDVRSFRHITTSVCSEFDIMGGEGVCHY